MAESKGSLLAKSVQKHAGRAKEKILRNLGKVDQTADDIFDEHLQNFNQQQAISSRLQKEFNNYIRCVRAMQTASKSLIDVLNEIYESNWADRDQFCSQLQNIEILWHDYGHKLADQVLIPMNTYQSQFPEMKKKIDKRGRKLVDFDNQRHNFQNLQQIGKKRDDVKILRAKEQLEEAKRTYELLNSELHDELPALYDSRILFTMTNLQTLFSTEQVFHSETAKLYGELEAVVDKLAMDNQRSPFVAKLKSPNSGNGLLKKMDNQLSVFNNHSNFNSNNNNGNNNNNNHSNNNADDVNHFGVPSLSVPSDSNTTNNNDDDDSSPFYTARSSKSGDAKSIDLEVDSDENSIQEHSSLNAQSSKTTFYTINSSDSKSIESECTTSDDNVAREQKTSISVAIPKEATVDGLPDGVYYKVKALYAYDREDDDELSFESGDILHVVDYEDPEEQEEGWLMGIKESTNEKGMFPFNFTRPI